MLFGLLVHGLALIYEGSDANGLLGTNSERHYSWGQWRALLELAYEYGWEPMGTVHADDSNWDGTYFANSGQFVRAEDSRGLAEAVSAALDDPDRKNKVRKRGTHLRNGVRSRRAKGARRSRSGPSLHDVL